MFKAHVAATSMQMKLRSNLDSSSTVQVLQGDNSDVQGISEA